MSLKHVPPNALYIITLTGILFAAKSIYKTPLPSNTSLFIILIALFILIFHKTHL